MCCRCCFIIVGVAGVVVEVDGVGVVVAVGDDDGDDDGKGHT